MSLPVLLKYLGRVNTKADWVYTLQQEEKEKERKNITTATESNSLAYTSQTDQWWEGQVMSCLKRKANMKPNAQGTKELSPTASTMCSSTTDTKKGEPFLVLFKGWWRHGELILPQKTERMCYSKNKGSESARLLPTNPSGIKDRRERGGLSKQDHCIAELHKGFTRHN